MKLITAGESHGKELLGVIEGFPAHVKLDFDRIDRALALRQSGYGRGARQKIERDTVEFMAGVRDGETLASPIAFRVVNRDYANWEKIMDAREADTSLRTVTKVRPGHADLTGMIKYGQTDARNILERSSARETAVRVAAGSICKELLLALGVEISGYVKEVCGVKDEREYAFSELARAKEEPLFMLDAEAQQRAMAKIDRIRASGDTAGGKICVRVKGLKRGFGSCMSYEEKLDGKLCGALMSVQAIKGVEVGMGMEVASHAGSEVHDEIYYDGEFLRKTNRAGGIEGGMSNGEEIVLTCAMKPIPTLMRGLETVDYLTHEPMRADTERSDVCAVCACEIILESVVATVLCQEVLKRVGGDTMEQVLCRYRDLP
ncbi:MAG: chorismate synthase [Clostridia bacterium]|nr:chorismate synthase [Clostridia bacterium]